MWNLPFNAHRYLIEPLSGEHAFVMMLSRYVKFIQNFIINSDRMAVNFMFQKIHKNVNSITGNNIHFIEQLTGRDIRYIDSNHIRTHVKFALCPKDEEWRVVLLKEVVNIKQNILTFHENDDNFLSNEELQSIIDYVSTY